MPKCEFHEICGLQADVDRDDGHCTLHSNDPAKSRPAFDALFLRHRETREGRFSSIVFPEGVDFKEQVFTTLMDFSCATFLGEVEFSDSTFPEGANFDYATFENGCLFEWVTFQKKAWFASANFKARSAESPGAVFNSATFDAQTLFIAAHFLTKATFDSSKFKSSPIFDETLFREEANFRGVVFEQGAEFTETSFGSIGRFSSSSFLGRTVFASLPSQPPIFSGTEVDFRNVEMKPLDAVIFRDADLSKCRFYNTDLREVEMTGVTWLRRRNRQMVYDEVASTSSFEATSPFGIERLYRQLKRNYEERRDYERVGDFHYGEKEMRRKNKQTPVANRFFLNLYWIVSGYGERYLRPLFSAAIVLIGSTFLYLRLGIYPKSGTIALQLNSLSHWARVTHYGLRIMTLLKSDDLVPSQEASWVNTIQSIFGPILIGLFVLALRQRLKR